MWCDKTLIISNDKSEVNQNSIIPSKKKQESAYKLWKRYFLIESLKVWQFVFTGSRFVLVSMWKGRLLFLYLARNFNRLYTTGLKIKLSFKTKQRFKKSQAEKWNNCSGHAVWYIPADVNRKFKLFQFLGSLCLGHAAVEKLLNESQEYVVIDRVMPCLH